MRLFTVFIIITTSKGILREGIDVTLLSQQKRNFHVSVKGNSFFRPTWRFTIHIHILFSSSFMNVWQAECWIMCPNVSWWNIKSQITASLFFASSLLYMTTVQMTFFKFFIKFFISLTCLWYRPFSEYNFTSHKDRIFRKWLLLLILHY